MLIVNKALSLLLHQSVSLFTQTSSHHRASGCFYIHYQHSGHIQTLVIGPFSHTTPN